MRATTRRNRELYIHVANMLERFGSVRAYDACARAYRIRTADDANPRFAHACRVYQSVITSTY